MRATPTYAQIIFPTGREATAFWQDIAPITERRVISSENCSTFEESLSPNPENDRCNNTNEIYDPSFMLSLSMEGFTADDNLPTSSITNRLTSK